MWRFHLFPSYNSLWESSAWRSARELTGLSSARRLSGYARCSISSSPRKWHARRVDVWMEGWMGGGREERGGISALWLDFWRWRVLGAEPERSARAVTAWVTDGHTHGPQRHARTRSVVEGIYQETRCFNCFTRDAPERSTINPDG